MDNVISLAGEKWMDKRMDEWMDKFINGWINGCTCMYNLMDGCMDALYAWPSFGSLGWTNYFTTVLSPAIAGATYGLAAISMDPVLFHTDSILVGL